MSGEPPEGTIPPAPGADAAVINKAPPLVAVDGEPRAIPVPSAPVVRAVPRPGGPTSVRKGTLPGHSGPPPAMSQPPPAIPAAPVLPAAPAVPAVTEADVASVFDDAAPTERRPSLPISPASSDKPPEIPAFLTPVPPRPSEPSPESGPSAGGPDSSPARRRSRRTVKIPDDAVPVKTPPAPQVAVVVTSVIPPLPPVPAALRPSAPPPAAPTAEPPSSIAPASDTFDVIRPMRIISIGSEAPRARSVPPPAEAAPAVDSTQAETPRQPTRPPPEPTLEARPKDAPPKPPEVEEVEAIEEDEEESARAKPEPIGTKTEELDAVEEVEPERISESGPPSGEIPVQLEDAEAPKPKKPPPPPPKRSTSIEPAPASTSPVPSAPASAPAAAAPPPPPAAPAVAVAPPASPSTVPTVDLSLRKRPKNWWEEIWTDDYLRTMEKVEPKVIKRECDFIDDRLGLEKGAVMLDLACGAGAHAVELASRGYNVVGYDLSLAMLARAQDEAQDRGQKLNFLQGDMREMAFEEAFDGVYSWSTSFGYFDDETNLNVLTRIHKALRKGGLLLLDVINRDYVAPRQPSLVWFEGDGCVCMDEMVVDFFTSRLKVKRTVMFDDGRSRECDYSIRLYGLHELGKMLHDCGFKVVEVTGHPAHPGVFFGSESPRIIVLAERD